MIIRIFNYELTLRKRFSLSSYFYRHTSGPAIEYDPPVQELWEYSAPIEKRLRVMSKDILKYAFRDCGLMMVRFPEEAILTFEGILSFVDVFKLDMVSKGATPEQIATFDNDVQYHISSTMILLQKQDPVVFNTVIEFYNRRIDDKGNDVPEL